MSTELQERIDDARDRVWQIVQEDGRLNGPGVVVICPTGEEA